MKGFPDLPPIWWLVSIGFIYLMKVLLPEWHVETALLGAVSWAVLCAALGIIGWSAIWFFRKRTPIEPHHQPKTLIIEGPYRLSRNPIYLALVMLTFASSLGQGSVFGILGAAILWKTLDLRFAAPEEQVLRQTFGPETERYLTRTRRWI